MFPSPPISAIPLPLLLPPRPGRSSLPLPLSQGLRALPRTWPQPSTDSRSSPARTCCTGLFPAPPHAPLPARSRKQPRTAAAPGPGSRECRVWRSQAGLTSLSGSSATGCCQLGPPGCASRSGSTARPRTTWLGRRSKPEAEAEVEAEAAAAAMRPVHRTRAGGIRHRGYRMSCCCCYSSPTATTSPGQSLRAAHVLRGRDGARAGQPLTAH